ncbi:quinone oxidoreductase family protein [Niallia sp. 03133]|uniref:quinone oxidoreductase family protein n=1 Tax=Niallia sp. 03133 TaxID=3458060 RepID=UPI004044DDD7
MKALVFNEFGDKDVLYIKEIAHPVLKPNEILLKMKAIGLNFADIYRRKGNFHLEGKPPFILGYEGAGVVETVGENVSGIKIGDRMAFADVPHANAELVAVPAEKAIPIPIGITDEQATALLLQGLTAQYLASDSYSVKQGDVVLVHSAAGGVGQLLVQIAKIKGANVIAITSTSEKAEAARNAGADTVLFYKENWVEQVKEATAGKGADAAYDAVGSTLNQSFAAVRTGGNVVFYGMAGGEPPLVDPRMLMDTSKTLTGGDLWNVLQTKEDRLARSKQLFDWMKEGKLRIQSPATFPLRKGADAHELLESRKSMGKILLIP